MYRQHYPEHPGMHNQQSPFLHRQQTFISKIQSSMVGVVIGLGIVMAASLLLFWNEGHAVKRERTLQDGLSHVISVDSSDVSADNEGHLIHVTGKLEVNDLYHDKGHGIILRAARVKRKVEMYQWIEHERKAEYEDDYGTTYSYSEEWMEEVVNSGQFHSEMGHTNPKDFPVLAETYSSTSVHIGHFRLSSGLVEQINDFILYQPSSAPIDSDLLLNHGYFYHSFDLTKPQIGDIRVYFLFAGLDGHEKVSVLGQQNKDSIVGYPTGTGLSLEILHHGKLTAEAIFSQEIMQNKIMTWLWRLAGWIGVFIGFSFLSNILVTSIDWIPFVREIITLGVGLMNFSISTSWSLLVIGCAWIWYRPLMGLMLVTFASIPFFLARRRNRQWRVG